MAVAVKNSTETSTSNPFDRMAIVSLVGMVYLLGSLAIVFRLIPTVWEQFMRSLRYQTDSFASGTLQAMVMLAAFCGLVILGGKLLGNKAPTGTRAGIFTGLVGLLLVVGVTRWVSLWLEYYCYSENLFGTSGETVGATITTVVGVGLLLLFLRWFFRPSTEKTMASFEDQGWFSATSYKKNQGQRVRRGTIVGLMLLLGSGVYTMVSHNTLARGSSSWAVNVPFTGTTRVTRESAGDALPILKEQYPDWASSEDNELQINRYKLRDINKKVDPDTYVKINKLTPGKREYEDKAIVPKTEFEKIKKEKPERVAGLVPVAPTPAYGTTTFRGITLLPAVQFSLPLLLLALSIWFSWRVVNLPAFADFLIATEAELNKVSWTTRKRLYQDTIVVLVTVLLMAFYLFAMDQVWGRILSWRPIGVIVFKQDDSGNKGADRTPW